MLPAVMPNYKQAVIREQVHSEGLLSCQASYKLAVPGQLFLLAALLL